MRRDPTPDGRAAGKLLSTAPHATWRDASSVPADALSAAEYLGLLGVELFVGEDSLRFQLAKLLQLS